MADAELRQLERAYKASGNMADGEAWVQAILRKKGVPVLPMIIALIQSRRTLEAISAHGVRLWDLSYSANLAIDSPITPQDIANFFDKAQNESL